MAWIGIGNTLWRRGGGTNWSSYWSQQPEVLFLGLYSDIADGKMPNRVVGRSDYLTVSGTPGSETFQCPVTQEYIDADLDNFWFESDTTPRTVTTAELIGYDISRTPVKYLDDDPNSVIAIMILKSDITGFVLDYLFRDMWLSIFWNDGLNDFGRIKSNKLIGRVPWNPLGYPAYFEPEAVAYLSRMTGQPDATRQELINTLIKGLKDDGVWSSIDVMRLDASHDQQSSLLNIKGDYSNGTPVGSPTFTVDRGWEGLYASKYIDSGYNPGDGAGGYNFVQDYAMAMGYYNVHNTVDSPVIYNQYNTIGGTWVFPYVNTYVYGNINSGVTTNRNSSVASGIGFMWSRRLNSAGMTSGRNLTGGTPVYASAPIVNANFKDAAGTGSRQAVVYYGAALPTATLLTAFQNRVLTYLTAIGAN